METEPYGACTGPARQEVSSTHNSDDPVGCACGRPATGYDARRGEATCRRCAHLRADGVSGHPVTCRNCATDYVLTPASGNDCPTCGLVDWERRPLDELDDEIATDGGHELVAGEDDTDDDADDAAIHVDSFTVHRAGDDENARPWGVAATVADRRTGRPYKAIKVEYDLDGTTAVLRSIHADPFHVRDLPLVTAADDAVDALPFVNAVSGVEQELQQGPPVAGGSA